MLTAIRERATGWIAWVIVILITIPFALWGVNSYFQGVNEISVATVNGEEISNYAYQDALLTQRRLLIDRFGSRFDPTLLDNINLKKQVVQTLVDRELLSQFIDEQNFRISDAQLSNIIQTSPEFLEDGVFNQALYLRLLNANRLSVQEFEQTQRRNGMINQLQQGINDSAFFTDMERDYLLMLDQQIRTTQYAVLRVDEFIDEFDVTDDDVKAYYEQNISRYQTESRIKVNYIELSVGSLSSSITPNEEQISALYEETKGQYKQARSREASHVLVSMNESDSEDEKQRKLKLANDILTKANQGEDFAVLAQQYSDDPGSKENGGELGVIVKGQMVKPFEDAVFEMVEGEIKGPVESRFGYHIIKLTSLSDEHQQTLEQVREQVLVAEVKLQAERLFAELVEPFKNVVFEDPDNLTTAADEMNLPIQTSDWFTASEGGGVAEHAAVRQVSFSEDMLNEGLVSSAIEIGFDSLIAVQKSEYQAAHAQSVDDVKNDIVASIKHEKASTKLQQVGSGLLDTLKSSEQNKKSWEYLIQQQSLEALMLPNKRSDIPANLTHLGDAAFTLPAPKEGGVQFGGLTLDNGDYALFVLEQVESGDLVAVEEEQRSAVELQLLDRDGSRMFEQFMEELRKNANTTILEQRL